MGGGDGVEYICNHIYLIKTKMTKNVKFLIGGLVVVAVLVAAYFGNAGGLFQGKLGLASTSYKNNQLGVEFNYKKYNKQKPFVDAQANKWFYKKDLQSLWSISVPVKPQNGMPANFDGYGIIRIRAYDSNDLIYDHILSELLEDVEVKNLTSQNRRNSRVLVFDVSGESVTAEALVFGKEYVLNIEMTWESIKNDAFQTVFQSVSF